MTTAQDRGWGPGWPNCQPQHIVPLAVHGVAFPGGIRKELHGLVELLLEQAYTGGYHAKKGQCWGYACRPIKRPDGADSDVPSNHSWGLAIDLNSAENVFGGSTHTMPARVVAMFKKYGFGWGGDYPGLKDWMHLEYLHDPAMAKVHTDRAKRDFAPQDHKPKIRKWYTVPGHKQFKTAILAGAYAGRKAAKQPDKTRTSITTHRLRVK